MRLIDVDLSIPCLWVSFPYDKQCAEAVRVVAGAQFDQGSRRWKVPIQSAESLLSSLDSLHFKFSPTMREWRENPAIAEDHGRGLAPEIFTVSTLNQHAQHAIQRAFPNPVWLDCQVEGVNRSRAHGNAFFELIEKTGEKTISRVTAVLFSKERVRVTQALDAVGVNFEDGLVLRLHVRPDVFVPSGSLQVTILDVDLSALQQSVERNRERILKELKKQGPLDSNARRPLAVCPLRVGVITSLNSDAMHDFVDELRQSSYGFSVTVFGATMQGAQMEASILRGLAYFSERANAFDVLVVIRGGGARTDLAWFDSFRLGLAVMKHPLRIVTGIGHHRDQSVLDHVGWACKTPTAAANALVGHLDRFVGRLEQVSHRLQNGLSRRVTTHLRKMDQIEYRIRNEVEKALDRSGHTLEQRAERLERSTLRRLENLDQGLSRLSSRVMASDPKQALKRGFVMVRSGQGIIRTADSLRRGDDIFLEFSDGVIRAIVEE